MVWVAVGRSGNELISKVEAGQRVHRRHLERIVQTEIREQARYTLSEHGLADPRRAMEEHVMPTRCGYFAGPLSLDLTHHICQVKMTVRMPTGPLAHYLIRIHRRQRQIAQKGDQLGDRGNTKDSILSTGLASPACRSGTITLVNPACCAARVAGKIPRMGRRRHPTPAHPEGLFHVILRL
jgi:hypothetical protein